MYDLGGNRNQGLGRSESRGKGVLGHRNLVCKAFGRMLRGEEVMAEKLTMTETRFEAELTQRYLLGIRVGIENVIGRLNLKAGEKFANRLDEDAKALRAVADMLERDLLPDANKAEDDHQRNYLDGEPEL